MDRFLEYAQVLMKLTRERRDALPENEKLKHSSMALIGGVAEAFQAAGIPAKIVSANVQIGLSCISNLTALSFGDPEQYMDIDGNTGWNAILDSALTRTKAVRPGQTITVAFTFRRFTINQSRQALRPEEIARVTSWVQQDRVLIEAKLIEQATMPRSNASHRPRL